jgi:succinyl-CoA synthetase beta subunit
VAADETPRKAAEDTDARKAAEATAARKAAAESAEEVLRDADTAMYEAKRAGRGRCVVFDSSMHDRVVQALEKSPVGVPVIVRLAGTHVEEGRRILARSGLPIIRANTLAEAAERAVAAWKNNANTVGLKVVNA